MWARIIMAILGVWLMAAPAVWGFGKKISDNDHIVGPLIATFSIISIWECTRNVRLANIPIGIWLLIAPWVLQYNNTTAVLNDYAVAVLIILLSLVKPKRENRFGGGWPAAWRSNSLHSRVAGNPHQIYRASLLILLFLTGCYTMRKSNGGGQVDRMVERKIIPADILVFPGYEVERIATGLNMPTALAFDGEGML